MTRPKVVHTIRRMLTRRWTAPRDGNQTERCNGRVRRLASPIDIKSTNSSAKDSSAAFSWYMTASCDDTLPSKCHTPVEWHTLTTSTDTLPKHKCRRGWIILISFQFITP